MRKAISALAIALNDEELLIRGHAAWALGAHRRGSGGAGARGEEEEDDWVRSGITAALSPVPAHL
jgi:hypothetical protein